MKPRDSVRGRGRRTGERPAQEAEDIIRAHEAEEILDGLDELLDEIDSVLEEQTVLTNYRQRGGQ